MKVSVTGCLLVCVVIVSVLHTAFSLPPDFFRTGRGRRLHVNPSGPQGKRASLPSSLFSTHGYTGHATGTTVGQGHDDEGDHMAGESTSASESLHNIAMTRSACRYCSTYGLIDEDRCVYEGPSAAQQRCIAVWLVAVERVLDTGVLDVMRKGASSDVQ